MIQNRPTYNVPAEFICLQKYFNLKANPRTIKNINERIWCPKFGNPTLLQLAIYYDHDILVDWLLFKKADVNIVTEVWGTALHVAVKLKRFCITSKLLNAGSKIDQKSSEKNCTPIYNLLEREEGEEKYSRWSILLLFIKNGLDLNKICIWAKSPLTLLEAAIKYEDVKIVNFLLNFGVSIDRVNDFDLTPLELAENNKIKELIMQHIVKLRVANLPVSDRNWKTVKEINPEVEYLQFKFLMEIESTKELTDSITGISYFKIFSDSEELNLFKKLSQNEELVLYDNIMKYFKSYSAIMISRIRNIRFELSDSQREVKNKYFELKKTLKFPMISKRLNCEEYGNPTLLQLAVFYGDEIFVAELVKWRADVNAINEVWGSALHIAVLHREAKIVEILLKAGARQIVSQNCTPVFHLLMHRKSFSPQILRKLIGYGLDINQVCSKFPGKFWKPLEVAVANGNDVAVRSLLECGADFNWVNVNNFTVIDLVNSLEKLENKMLMVNIIKNHIVKLAAAGLRISQRNLRAVENFDLNLKSLCEKEVQVMKNTRFPLVGLTYYDVLQKSDKDLVEKLRSCEKIVKNNGAVEKLFGSYGEILKNKLAILKIKKSLLPPVTKKVS